MLLVRPPVFILYWSSLAAYEAGELPYAVANIGISSLSVRKASAERIIEHAGRLRHESQIARPPLERPSLRRVDEFAKDCRVNDEKADERAETRALGEMIAFELGESELTPKERATLERLVPKALRIFDAGRARLERIETDLGALSDRWIAAANATGDTDRAVALEKCAEAVAQIARRGST